MTPIEWVHVIIDISLWCTQEYINNGHLTQGAGIRKVSPAEMMLPAIT